MNKEKMIDIIEKEFGINSNISHFGSCTENFLNDLIMKTAKEHNFPKEIIELFKNKPYKVNSLFREHYHCDNGKGAGQYFIKLLKENN